ncbi:hypothetical protein ACOWPH_09545 [Anabaena sp. PCC 7938]|uniref:hypothetical protein n=1 Tax=Anabaena TaxID=1163 RepID=UPI000694D11F|nr:MULTISPECIES: hypothetical protein [Anabaena]MCM2407330.1 hypothetical protein [Anabaena sp. CCAP 1446/1C]
MRRAKPPKKATAFWRRNLHPEKSKITSGMWVSLNLLPKSKHTNEVAFIVVEGWDFERDS